MEESLPLAGMNIEGSMAGSTVLNILSLYTIVITLFVAPSHFHSVPLLRATTADDRWMMVTSDDCYCCC